MNAAPLHTDVLAGDPNIVPKTHSYLRTHGFKVNIESRHLVVSDSGKGYVVQEVNTHEKEFERADVVSDRTTIWTCTCEAYRYQQGVSDAVEDGELEWEPCKHCRFVIGEHYAQSEVPDGL